jgi:hypothetical protein
MEGLVTEFLLKETGMAQSRQARDEAESQPATQQPKTSQGDVELF